MLKNMSPKDCLQFIAVAFLGCAGMLWIWKGDPTNAAWAFGAIAGYAFKNGVKEVTK